MIIKTSKKDEIIEITEQIEQNLKKQGIRNGACIIFAKHTTCCITTADLDPGTDLDLLNFLRKIQPDIHYRHPHNPVHTPDHILSSIIGPGVTIPIENGELVLGSWQRIVLIELDGPKERNIFIRILS